MKAQTESSDISSSQDQAREERVEIDQPVGLDRSVLPNSSDNCENERTTVLYMKVETTFLSLNVEGIMGLILEVDRIGLSHGEAV